MPLITGPTPGISEPTVPNMFPKLNPIIFSLAA
jgi:hypothetical protein